MFASLSSRSLSISGSLSSLFPLLSLFPVLSHPLLSPQRTLAKGQDSLRTPSNVPSLHPFHSSVSQGDSLCSVLSQIVMTTFISLVGWWILVTLESIWHLLWGEHLMGYGPWGQKVGHDWVTEQNVNLLPERLCLGQHLPIAPNPLLQATTDLPSGSMNLTFLIDSTYKWNHRVFIPLMVFLKEDNVTL